MNKTDLIPSKMSLVELVESCRRAAGRSQVGTGKETEPAVYRVHSKETFHEDLVAFLT